jgi:hypothetical protein
MTQATPLNDVTTRKLVQAHPVDSDTCLHTNANTFVISNTNTDGEKTLIVRKAWTREDIEREKRLHDEEELKKMLAARTNNLLFSPAHLRFGLSDLKVMHDGTNQAYTKISLPVKIHVVTVKRNVVNSSVDFLSEHEASRH